MKPRGRFVQLQILSNNCYPQQIHCLKSEDWLGLITTCCSRIHTMLKANRLIRMMPACRRVCATDPSMAADCRGRDRVACAAGLSVAWGEVPAGRGAISGAASRVSDKAKTGKADQSSNQV
jgi:hypothetical protein